MAGERRVGRRKERGKKGKEGEREGGKEGKGEKVVRKHGNKFK